MELPFLDKKPLARTTSGPTGTTSSQVLSVWPEDEVQQQGGAQDQTHQLHLACLGSTRKLKSPGLVSGFDGGRKARGA